MSFLKAHGKSRMNYYRSATERETPSQGISLLEKYLQISSSLVPPSSTEDIHAPTLWHPDLHLDNVFVDPETLKITGIIDWQGTSILPFYFHAGVPRMFNHPGPLLEGWAISERPEDYDDLETTEKARIDNMRDSETCHKFYEAQTRLKNPRHSAALQTEGLEMRTAPTRLVPGLWEDRDSFFLRDALISIIAEWKDLRPDAGECPASFSEQELSMHAHEAENIKGISTIVDGFREKWYLPVDGMVDPAEYALVSAGLAHFREVFLDSAEDAEEREQFRRLWPYQDTDE